MTVYESDLPGVGRKYELETDEGTLVVIIHHDGLREVYRRPAPDADAQKLFEVSIGSARQLAAILQGTDFETVDVKALSAPLGEAIIEWREVSAESDYVGQTLEEAHIRGETGVSVIAVQRAGETHPNPPADFTIESGDILVTLGTREEQAALDEFLD